MNEVAKQSPSTSPLRRLKERFKRLQHGRARRLVAVVATLEQTLLHRSPVRITVDSAGDWYNFRKKITLVSPELNVTTYEDAHEVVADRWCHGCDLKPGDVVIDIGAGIGDDAAIFSRMVGPTGRVIAIEAHPVTYRCLTKTIAANGLTNVTPLHLAVSDCDGSISISEQANFLSNSIIDGQSGVEVPMRRLDEVCAEMGITAPRLIKMNIEGAETAALKGSSGLMKPGTRFVISCHDFKTERGDGEFFRTSGPVRALFEEGGLTVEQRTDAALREVYWILYGEK